MTPEETKKIAEELVPFCIEHRLRLKEDGTCPRCFDANGDPYVLDMQSRFLMDRRDTTNSEKRYVAELRQWADRCERQGRTSQAILVRNMAYEIEHGAPWLAFMAEEQRKREIAQTHEAMLDRASQNFDFGGGE